MPLSSQKLPNTFLTTLITLLAPSMIPHTINTIMIKHTEAAINYSPTLGAVVTIGVLTTVTAGSLVTVALWAALTAKTMFLKFAPATPTTTPAKNTNIN